jgi:hypothetical protein
MATYLVPRGQIHDYVSVTFGYTRTHIHSIFARVRRFHGRVPESGNMIPPVRHVDVPTLSPKPLLATRPSGYVLSMRSVQNYTRSEVKESSSHPAVQGTDEWNPPPPSVPKTDEGPARARTAILSQNHRPLRHFRIY